MGIRGPQPKPDDRRQRRNKRATIALASSPGATIPDTDPKWLKSTAQDWRVFWESELASATRAPHLRAVRRLFALYDERDRAYRSVQRNGRVTTGSTGQVVLNPLLKYIAQCDAEIRQGEDRLGLSPRSMAQLGSAFAGAQKSLDDLNRDMSDDEPDDGNSDPRIEVVS